MLNFPENELPWWLSPEFVAVRSLVRVYDKDPAHTIISMKTFSIICNASKLSKNSLKVTLSFRKQLSSDPFSKSQHKYMFCQHYNMTYQTNFRRRFSLQRERESQKHFYTFLSKIELIQCKQIKGVKIRNSVEKLHE